MGSCGCHVRHQAPTSGAVRPWGTSVFGDIDLFRRLFLYRSEIYQIDEACPAMLTMMASINGLKISRDIEQLDQRLAAGTNDIPGDANPMASSTAWISRSCPAIGHASVRPKWAGNRRRCPWPRLAAAMAAAAVPDGTAYSPSAKLIVPCSVRFTTVIISLKDCGPRRGRLQFTAATIAL